MKEIEFSKEVRDILVNKIKLYFKENLDQDIGGFDAEFLLDFFSREIGSHYYNQALYDSQAILSKRLESISEAILDLEKVSDLNK